MSLLSYVPSEEYSESGYITGVPRLHEALRFKFRPLTPAERSKIVGDLDRLPMDKRDLKIAAEMKKHLTEWDLKDAKDSPVSISVAVLLQLKPGLFYRLWAILLGTEAPDADEGEKTETLLEQLEDEIAAGATGHVVGDVREEKELGN